MRRNVLRLVHRDQLGDAAERHSLALVLISVALYVCYFSWFTILNHHTFQTYAYDLGIYMQSLWTTIHGYGVFYTSLWEGSRFVFHFEPILVGVLPLYAVCSRAETLLVLQSVALGVGAVPVYLLSRPRLGPLAGVGFSLLYVLNPAVHGVNTFDFHATSLAVPLLLSMHYCMSVGRLRLGVVFAVVALACRENVSLVVFLSALYWAWRWRRRDMLSVERSGMPIDHRFLVATTLALVALSWLLLTMNLIIPHFAGTDRPGTLDRYDDAFSNLGVDRPGKLSYLVQLLGPLGFLSLMSPLQLMIGLPILAQNLLSNWPHMYSLFQNSALLIPWLFVSAIDGAAEIVGSAREDTDSLRRKLLAALLVVATLFALLYSHSPIATGRSFPVVTDHHRVAEEVIDLLPADAFVFVQNDFFPHVCHRHKVDSLLFRVKVDFFRYDILFPNTVVERVDGAFDYILMDTKSPQSLSLNMVPSSWATLREEYGLYAKGDGVLLYKRGYRGDTIEISIDGG